MLPFTLMLIIILYSTTIYFLLIVKTKVNKRYLLIDNIIICLLTFILIYYLRIIIISYIITTILIVPVLIIIFTMIRFWRNPNRKINQDKGSIVSPADGRVKYIKYVEKNSSIYSEKNGVIIKLLEIERVDKMINGFWQVGINMTLFDVHKNCAPVDGEIVLSIRTNGDYLSLKNKNALNENERHTYIIKNKFYNFAVIQIASKLVRRIDSYVQIGDFVKKGRWLGMIRFGSQVDVILPSEVEINIKNNQQVYAGKTIIGTLHDL